MKLVVGLGNPGKKYEKTRHNCGYNAINFYAAKNNLSFKKKFNAEYCEKVINNEKMLLVKPTTYMNLSGNAVRYWLEKENIPTEHLLVIVDDLALPIGKMRLRGNGSNGGHNGLGHIQQLIGQKYARLRIGIGNEFQRGAQIDYVLTKFSDEERKTISPLMETSCEIIKSFILAGIDRTMNAYNGK